VAAASAMRRINIDHETESIPRNTPRSPAKLF